LINQTVGKILDQFDVAHTLFRRWTGASTPQGTPAGDGA
jgi:3-polyprenyl-4-hydroxybenzoate decarboxylase